MGNCCKLMILETKYKLLKQSKSHQQSKSILKYPKINTMSKLSSDPITRAKQLYQQAQFDVNNDRLNRITQDRMTKRYTYAQNKVKQMQSNGTTKDLPQMKFYRDKFKTISDLIQNSMRQSYKKNKFQTEAKQIFSENFKGQKYDSKDKNERNNSNISNNNKLRDSLANKNNKSGIQKKDSNNNQSGMLREESNSPVRKKQSKKEQNRRVQFEQENRDKNKSINRSKSPLDDFFAQKDKSLKKSNNFKSIVPKSQQHNKQLLSGLKSMHKKPQSKIRSDRSLTPDSKIRDIKRQNQQLQKILRRRQRDRNLNSNDPQTLKQLQKQAYYFKKVNQELKEKSQSRYTSSSGYYQGGQGPYDIPYKKNNVRDIDYRNMHYTSTTQNRNKNNNWADRSNNMNRSRSRSMTKSHTSNASKVQNQRQVYINRTPQILFQNELMKVLVVRHPIKIEEKMFPQSIKSLNNYQNPQEIIPNEEKLQLLILNNSNNYVKNQEFNNIKVTYQHDRSTHQYSNFIVSKHRYKKNIIQYKDIVYSQMIRIRLLDRNGYNEEFKAKIMVNFFYNPISTQNRKSNRMVQILNKQQDTIDVQIKLPITFIQFSSKPFLAMPQKQARLLKKQKLSIIPNPLYDTFEHTYINTKLPLKKAPSYKGTKQKAVMYGRSYIHGRSKNGTYLESQIEITWTQNAHKASSQTQSQSRISNSHSQRSGVTSSSNKMSISTISQWVYLISYLFMDLAEQEAQFQKQYRKPSMHVRFQSKKYQYVNDL